MKLKVVKHWRAPAVLASFDVIYSNISSNEIKENVVIELEYKCPHCEAEYVVMTDEEEGIKYCPFCGSDGQDE